MRCIYHIQKTTWCLWPVNKFSQWLNSDGSNFPTTTYNSLIFSWSYNLLEKFWSTWTWKEKHSGHLPATQTLKTIQKPQLAWNKKQLLYLFSLPRKLLKSREIYHHTFNHTSRGYQCLFWSDLLHWQEKWTGVGDMVVTLVLDVLFLVALDRMARQFI